MRNTIPVSHISCYRAAIEVAGKVTLSEENALEVLRMAERYTS